MLRDRSMAATPNHTRGGFCLRQQDLYAQINLDILGDASMHGEACGAANLHAALARCIQKLEDEESLAAALSRRLRD